MCPLTTSAPHGDAASDRRLRLACRKPPRCLYFTLAAFGLAGPLSFRARSRETVSPFFTSATSAGGKCTMIVPSDVFTCTHPVFALTLVTLPSMVWRPVIWSGADCAEAAPTLATRRAAARDTARRLFICTLPCSRLVPLGDTSGRGRAIDLFTARIPPLPVEVLSVFVRARRNPHHDSTLFDALLVQPCPLFGNA